MMVGGRTARKSLLVEIGGDLIRRLSYPAVAVLIVSLIGTLGYFIAGHGARSLLDSAYMTSITLTTVGYGEIFEFGQGGRAFTLLLMWGGWGVMVYAAATVTAFFVEKNPAHLIRERLMEQHIEDLKDHYIICGGGETAVHILRELVSTKRPCVVVESEAERISRLREHFGDLLVLHGDPTDEAVLLRAGLTRAAGIFAALGDDGPNMLVTVLANFNNADLKIVSECRDNSLTSKFYRAGADYVVNPMFIGGMRMVSEMVRPQVVTFLDRMLRDQTAHRVEQVMVGEQSAVAGKKLAEAALREHSGLTPIALERPDGTVVFNPGPEDVLTPGIAIIVIGDPDQMARLRAYCSS